MCDTLQDQDRLVLTSSYYYTPARGDIVVINRYTQEPLIKRIIAVEGDKLEITAAGRVIVNDKELTENYIRGGKDGRIGSSVPTFQTEKTPLAVPAHSQGRKLRGTTLIWPVPRPSLRPRCGYCVYQNRKYCGTCGVPSVPL